ncbi:hypothetical protein [Nocardia sp. NPDC050406]|uniref:hypothetical protein n=1 Tax=Nocardia sp. NPDC050406 TaxID=3364318 RepID=UPI0037908DDE
MYAEGLILGAHLPSGWLWPALIIFGSIIFVGMVVLLLVAGARFDDPQGVITPTPPPGSCAPFCTEQVYAPAQQW